MDEEAFRGNAAVVDVTETLDVSNVEAAIQSIYSSGQNPEVISQLDAELRRLQRSPAGWKLGDDLLDSEDERVRFFGALTLTIKINSDWAELGVEDIQTLFRQLLLRFLQAVARNSRALVVRKLCSAFVAYFLRDNVTWTLCLRNLTVALRQGQVTLEKDLDSPIPMDVLLGEVKPEQTLALLWFCQILAEEVAKHDSRRMSSTGILDRLTPNLVDIMEMLQYYLTRAIGVTSSPPVSAIAQEALTAFQAWVKLSHHTWITENTYSKPMSTLLLTVIDCVPIGGLTQAATALICDVIREWSKLFDESTHHATHSLFMSPFGMQQVSDLQSGDFDDEKVSFANLILEYVDMQANRFGRQQGENIFPMQKFVSAELLEYCHRLLQCDGIPGQEDEVCVSTVTIWTNLLGLLEDSAVPRTLGWFQDMRGHINQAVLESLQKLRLPPNEIVLEWDREQVDGFAGFRRETSEFFELAYWFLQLPESNELFDILVEELATKSLADSDWEGLEVSLYCLNSIAEFVIKPGKHDAALESFLQRGLFAHLSSVGEQLSIPAYKTAIRWVGEYAPFFKRRPHLLPSALQFLFNMLPSPSLADPTAKAISHLCDSCRNHLVQHIEELTAAFEKFRVLPSANSYVKEKLIRAISTVGQALEGNDAKVKYLEYILTQLEEGARAAHDLFLHGQFEESSSLALEVLRCLKIVGKAFQETSVDLDVLESKPEFWSQGVGHVVQNRILNVLELPFAVKQGVLSIELLETACGAINSGLTEINGSFRLPASNIATFICRCDGADSLCTALSTANALVSAHSTAISPRIDEEVAQIFLHVTTVLMQSPSRDEPDLVHEALSLLSCMCQRYVNVLFETSTSLHGGKAVLLIDLLSSLFMSCLISDDPRPKRAAATLWTKLLERPKGAAVVPNRSDWLKQTGQDLTGWLIWNFAGGASRSHLEFLVPVLNKLVFASTMQVQAWIDNSFRSETFWPKNAKASEEQRRVWAAKILALRGRRKETRELVEEFWLTCRGTAFRYT